MHCQTHGASSAPCRCHECQSLLCMACWTDHYLGVLGHYPQELDIPHEQQEEMRTRTPGSSNTRTVEFDSWLSARKGSSSVPQTQKSRCAPPSPKATARTTSTSSPVILTPASSHHSDSDLRYAGLEQYGRPSKAAGDIASGRERSEHDVHSILAKYMNDSKQPWSPYNLRYDQQNQNPSGGETRR